MSERQSDKTENYHQHRLYLGRFGVDKVRLIINALCLYSELCFLCGRGRHFQKKYEKSCREVKNGAQSMSDTSKYHQHGLGYMEMSSKSCWICHQSRHRRSPVTIIRIFAMLNLCNGISDSEYFVHLFRPFRHMTQP